MIEIHSRGRPHDEASPAAAGIHAIENDTVYENDDHTNTAIRDNKPATCVEAIDDDDTSDNRPIAGDHHENDDTLQNDNATGRESATVVPTPVKRHLS